MSQLDSSPRIAAECHIHAQGRNRLNSQSDWHLELCNSESSRGGGGGSRGGSGEGGEVGEDQEGEGQREQVSSKGGSEGGRGKGGSEGEARSSCAMQTELGCAVLREKDIGRLYVAVDHLPDE